MKVKELKEFSQEETVDELPHPLKQKITEEILLKLRSSNASSNNTQQRGQYNPMISLLYSSLFHVFIWFLFPRIFIALRNYFKHLYPLIFSFDFNVNG